MEILLFVHLSGVSGLYLQPISVLINYNFKTISFSKLDTPKSEEVFMVRISTICTLLLSKKAYFDQ